MEKLDIRVGTIDGVNDIAESDKLVALTVDLGDHQRTIVAGLKQERPTRGRSKDGRRSSSSISSASFTRCLSEGMLFDIGYADGVTPVLACPEKPVPNGTRAG